MDKVVRGDRKERREEKEEEALSKEEIRTRSKEWKGNGDRRNPERSLKVWGRRNRGVGERFL